MLFNVDDNYYIVEKLDEFLVTWRTTMHCIALLYW